MKTIKNQNCLKTFETGKMGKLSQYQSYHKIDLDYCGTLYILNPNYPLEGWGYYLVVGEEIEIDGIKMIIENIELGGSKYVPYDCVGFFGKIKE